MFSMVAAFVAFIISTVILLLGLHEIYRQAFTRGGQLEQELNSIMGKKRSINWPLVLVAFIIWTVSGIHLFD